MSMVALLKNGCFAPLFRGDFPRFLRYYLLKAYWKNSPISTLTPLGMIVDS